jgi:VanZ family protein
MFSLLKNNKVAPVATFFVFILHLIQVPSQSEWGLADIIALDKLAHFLLFGGLTFLWLLFPWRNAPSNAKLFLALIGYAVLMEIFQTALTVYRSGELLDLLFDAAAVFVVLRMRKKIILS